MVITLCDPEFKTKKTGRKEHVCLILVMAMAYSWVVVVNLFVIQKLVLKPLY